MINEIHRITLNHQSTCTCIRIEILVVKMWSSNDNTSTGRYICTCMAVKSNIYLTNFSMTLC